MSDVSNLDTEFFRSEIIVNVNYQRNTGTGPCFINEHERIEARGRCESICLFLLYDLTDVVGLRSTLLRGNFTELVSELNNFFPDSLIPYDREGTREIKERISGSKVLANQLFEDF